MAGQAAESIGDKFTFVDAGVAAVRDRVTYLAGAAGFLPVLGVLILGFLVIRESSYGYVSGPTDVFTESLGWTIGTAVVAVLSMTWAAIAVSLRNSSAAVTGQYLTAAFARLPAAIGAWLLLYLCVGALALLTLGLGQIASKEILSFIVAILALPLGVMWALLLLGLMVAGAFIPAFAASNDAPGPVQILRRMLGLLVVDPGLVAVVLAVAAIAAGSMAIFFFTGASLATVVLGGLASQMWVSEYSALLVGFWSLLILSAAWWGPWGAFVAMMARFVSDRSASADFDAAASRLLGASRERFQSGGTAGPIDLTSPASPAPAPPPPAPVAAPAAMPRPAAMPAPAPAPAPPVPAPASAPGPEPTCEHCNAVNPPGFRFCGSCGQLATLT